MSTVVIVENLRLLREILSQELMREGYSAVGVDSAEDFLEYLNDYHCGRDSSYGSAALQDISARAYRSEASFMVKKLADTQIMYFLEHNRFSLRMGNQ